MVGTVWGLGLAGLFLLATHFGMAALGARGALVDRLGEGGYRGVYSLVALAAFAWLVMAYGAVPYVRLWDWAPWQSWVPAFVLPFALLLAVGGLTAPNPTSVGQEKALVAAEPVRGVLRITRHPFLWGVGLWGLAHIPPNGDVGSLLFFATLTALALVGARLLDRKKRRAGGADWRRFEEATSFWPFGAVARGDQSLPRAAAEFGSLRLGLTVVLYGALLYGHPWLFGVPALPQ